MIGCGLTGDRAWIALSSTLILFNKQVLGYGHFGQSPSSFYFEQILTLSQHTVRLPHPMFAQTHKLTLMLRSNYPNNMAPNLRNNNDPTPRPLYEFT